MNVNIYGTDRCPKCDILKKFLTSLGVDYNYLDMSDPGNIAYLMANDGWPRDAAAPVLEIELQGKPPRFMTHFNMFNNGALKETFIAGWVGVMQCP